MASLRSRKTEIESTIAKKKRALSSFHGLFFILLRKRNKIKQTKQNKTKQKNLPFSLISLPLIQEISRLSTKQLSLFTLVSLLFLGSPLLFLLFLLLMVCVRGGEMGEDREGGNRFFSFFILYSYLLFLFSSFFSPSVASALPGYLYTIYYQFLSFSTSNGDVSLNV